VADVKPSGTRSCNEPAADDIVDSGLVAAQPCPRPATYGTCTRSGLAGVTASQAERSAA
jgi:hypothetical protein